MATFTGSIGLIEALTFEEFIEKKKGGVPLDDREITLLREAWNQGVDSACSYFSQEEGTDHGARKALTVQSQTRVEVVDKSTSTGW